MIRFLFLITCVFIERSLAEEPTGTILPEVINNSSIAKPFYNITRAEAQSESETKVTTHPSSLRLHTIESYKSINDKPPADIDILNDSSEVDDIGGTSFKDFALPNNVHEDPSTHPEDNKTTKHVFKVPKNRNKKTMSQGNLNFATNEFSSGLSNSTLYQNYFHAFEKLYDHFVWDTSSFRNVNYLCSESISIYLSALKEHTSWALKVSDASGKYRGLFFFENDYWLGSKQFCHEINRENENAEEIPRLKYFVIRINVFLHPMKKATKRYLNIGQCLPATCSPKDVLSIMNNDPAFIYLNGAMIKENTRKIKATKVSLIDVRIVPGDYNLWAEHKLYVFIVVCTAILTLVIVATIYENKLTARGVHIRKPEDIGKSMDSLKGKSRLTEIERCEMSNMNNNNNETEYSKAQENNNQQGLGMASKILLCFAYGSNSDVILSTSTNSEDSLTCIHGLRVFSLMWTIMVHTYLQIFGIGENKFNRTISERTFLYQVVGNATFSVDTFFFISGLLVVLLFLRTEKNKRQKLYESGARNELSQSRYWSNSMRKSFVLIFYRFLRLTPIYIIIISITELAMKVVYNDSVFTPGLHDHFTCNKFWWRNILFINNFYPLNEICLMWGWYLANDFQFYVITVFLLILSTRYLKLSLVLSVILLVVSWVTTILISLHFKYIHKVSEPFESFDILYDKPWQRFGPYAMGMVTGYVLYRVKVPPRIPFAINLCLWIFSSSVLLSIIFGVPGGKLTLITTSLYVSLGHSAWGIALMWITIACCWKIAEPINNILSFKGFLPLSRLTYCTYLVHPTIMMITSFQSESPTHLTHGMVLTSFLGNTVISFLIAFIFSIMFEAPVIRILKLCFKTK